MLNIPCEKSLYSNGAKTTLKLKLVLIPPQKKGTLAIAHFNMYAHCIHLKFHVYMSKILPFYEYLYSNIRYISSIKLM